VHVIGLTGNIATGKSTVAGMLGHLGAEVIDADRLVHAQLRPGGAAVGRIVARFGEAVQDSHGGVDRARLGAIVFRNPGALADLEAILHPAVVEDTLQRLSASNRPVVVVEAIKLLEAQMQAHCDAVWVTICPRWQQLERLARTRGFTPAEAAMRVDGQPPASRKVARADVVIDTSVSLDVAWRQVARAWNALPDLPRARLCTGWLAREEVGVS
jgi:dephospho-CoA kinase